jgi:hypothetical protein
MRVASEVALLICLASVAHADEDVRHRQAVLIESDAMSGYASTVAVIRKNGVSTTARKLADDPSKCTDVIAQQASLVKADDVLSGDFEGYPEAVQSGISWRMPASHAKDVCAAYAKWRGVVKPMLKFELLADFQHTEAGDDAARYFSDKTWQRCLDDVAGAKAAGAPADVAVHFGTTELTLDQLEARCRAKLKK